MIMKHRIKKNNINKNILQESNSYNILTDGEILQRQKKENNGNSKPEEKIYVDAIEISINNTQRHLKDEMINFQKIANKNTGTQFGQESNIKQKIEKKEMERLIQNQLLIKPDLSFEAEIKRKLEL